MTQDKHTNNIRESVEILAEIRSTYGDLKIS